MSIIERMQDPQLLVGMSLGEKISGALITMVLGMGTCLIVLAIIMLLVNIMHRIMEPKEKKSAKAPAGAAAKIDDETAAVIAGAVAEMEGGKPFDIVSIKQVSK